MEASLTAVAELWFLLPVSVVAATLAMAAGIGGAVFFTPIFVLILDLPAPLAVAAALATQLFGFLSGATAYWRRGLIDRALAGRLVAMAAPAALAGSLATSVAPPLLFRRLFGVVAIAIAWQVFAAHRRNRRPTPAPPDDNPQAAVGLTTNGGLTYRYRWPPLGEAGVVAGVGGLLLGLISVGLAELASAFLVVRGRLPSPVAVATTIGATVVALVVAAATHLVMLAGRDDGSLAALAPILALTVPGVLTGGQIGPGLQAWLGPARLEVGIAGLLVAVGVVMMVVR